MSSRLSFGIGWLIVATGRFPWLATAAQRPLVEISGVGSSVLATPAWTNVRMTPPCDPVAYEISLARSPIDPLRLMAGAIDSSGPSCGAASGEDGAYLSTDGGMTWTIPAFSAPAGTAAWDPSIAFDRTGVAIYCSLFDTGCGSGPGCSVASFRSTDAGATWPGYSSVYPVTFNDKPWVAFDTGTSSPYSGRAYCVFDHLSGGLEEQAASSTDGGVTWGPPITVYGNMVWATTTIDSAGRLYIAGIFNGSRGLPVVLSTDGGQTFAAPVNAYTFQGTGGGVTVNSSSLQGIDTDRGTGLHAGRIYVGVFDQRAGQAHNHIWVVHSDDQGSTWSAPVQVDGDATDTHDHAYSWLACSPTNGGVHVFYYDFGCPSAGLTTPYRYSMASSTDGGTTWHQMSLQDASAEWNTSLRSPGGVGDHEAGVASDGLIYGAWSDSRDGSATSKAFLQPVPNPMPWISSISPLTANSGATTPLTISGGNLVPTITPFAIVFDDPAITGTITGATNTAINVNVTIASGAAGGMHEWSLKYGVPVGSATVVAAAKSGCQFALNAYIGTPTATITATITATATSSATSTSTFTISLTPTASRTQTATSTFTATVTQTFTVTTTPTPAGPVFVYPNPVSISTDPRVYFGNVPGNALIEVYNLAGEKVVELAPDADGIARWYLLTPNGYSYARGLYVWRARYGGYVDRGVIAVVR